MKFLKRGLLASAFVLAAGVGAQAADITPDVPSDIETTASSGVYLRGDAGWSFLEWSGGDDDSNYVVGGGVGYQFNDFLRSDVTLDMSGDYSVAPGAEISTTTVLGNVYFDWATDTAFTPYVGLGAGYGWVENNPNGVALGVSAGVAVGVTENLDIDLGYRFRDIMSGGPDVMEHQTTLGMRFKF